MKGLVALRGCSSRNRNLVLGYCFSAVPILVQDVSIRLAACTADFAGKLEKPPPNQQWCRFACTVPI